MIYNKTHTSCMLLAFSVCILFSCMNNKHTENVNLLEIELYVKEKDNPFGNTLMPLSFLDTISSDFKGVVYNDSSIIGYLNIIKTRDLDTLYSRNKIAEDIYKNMKTKIYCLTGFKNGNQFYVLDFNGNKNFNDDKFIEFDKNLKYKTETDKKIRDSFSFLDMEVFKLEKDVIYKDKIFIKIFPNANYFNYKNENEEQKFLHSLQLIAELSDYYYGEFVLSNNKRYKVAINKYSWHEPELMFRNIDSAFYKNSTQNFNKYKLSDTIKIEQTYYKIDKIVYNPPKLELKPILIHDKFNGFRIGSSIENHIVEDLEGNKHVLKDLFKNKELLLLDFWGTWCEPCKKLTPDLIALEEKYKLKLNLVSLAYEQDLKPVKDYTSSNNMGWFNGFVKGEAKLSKSKPKIIKDLRVECFPTFILLDKNLNIIYRSCGGGDSFSNLVDFINKY